MKIEVLVEGYQDRAFWKGMLMAHDWKENRTVASGAGRYAYEKNEKTLVITPCHGDTRVEKKTVRNLKELTTDPVDVLVFNVDADTVGGFDDGSIKQKLGDLVEQAVGHYLPLAHPDGFKVTVDTCETKVFPVVWGAETDLPAPEKQTLERLVCAGLLTAYPERAACVSSFLSADPPGGEGHKHHAMAYMAKWAADRGSEDFYRAVWDDDAVAKGLKTLLAQTGAWAVISSFL